MFDDSSAAPQSPEQPVSAPAVQPRLSEIFARPCIQQIALTTDRFAVIRTLVETLARENRIAQSHAEWIAEELIVRDRQCGSASEKGLAFPHLRTPRVQTFVGAIGYVPGGVAFASRDRKPTKLVFLMLSPWADRVQHLAILASLASLIHHKALHLQLDHGIEPTDIHRHLVEFDQRNHPPKRSVAEENVVSHESTQD